MPGRQDLGVRSIYSRPFPARVNRALTSADPGETPEPSLRPDPVTTYTNSSLITALRSFNLSARRSTTRKR
jgi:hypothetical protein